MLEKYPRVNNTQLDVISDEFLRPYSFCYFQFCLLLLFHLVVFFVLGLIMLSYEIYL
jgi:hypothetical protein